jgi:putative ABC transport system permease protein
MTQYENVTASAWIEKNKAAEFLLKDKNATFMNGRYLYCAQVDVLDNNSLKKYAKEAGLDYNQLTDTKHPCAVVINSVIYKDDKEGKYVETKIVKTNIGEKLDLLFTQGSENKKTSKEIKLPVKVAATTNKMPMGVMALGKTASFHVIMSEAAFNKMVSGKDISTSTKIYLNSKKPLKLQEELEKIQEEVGANTLSIINLYDIRLHNQQALLVVNVFTYAFIILITAICIANIINTISTSISLRKREFAMLKSIGITPKGFNKMLNYESLFYGIKALVYGLPLSILVMYLMYRVLMAKFDYDFFIPLTSIYIVIVAVFIIVGTAMLYSSSRVRKENIIDALKQESI